MWEDERDKKIARNQMIGMLGMLILLMIWLQYFMPQPPVQPPPEPGAAPGPSETAESAGRRAAVPSADETSLASFLPPRVSAADPAPGDVILENDSLRLVFTPVGARLKEAIVRLDEVSGSDIDLVPKSPELTDAEALYPLGLRFTDESVGDALDFVLFEVAEHSGNSVTFTVTLENHAVVQKKFSLDPSRYVLDVEVVYENLRPEPQRLGLDTYPAYALNWAPNIASGDLDKGVRQRLVWRQNNANDYLDTTSLKPERNGHVFTKNIVGPEWLAVKSAYFAVAMRPEYEGASASISGDHEAFTFGLAVPRTEIPGGASASHAFRVYMGPSSMAALEAAWPTLPTIQRFFQWPELMDRFAKLLLDLLNWFHGIVPNYGVAIIALTVLVRLVMFPLTWKQVRSMKKMQLLQPEMEEIRKKYADDQQEQGRRMMELYRERGVNPMSGCLPVFLQMPVFIALYRMLWSAFELRGADFIWWINDLSEPDRMLHMPFMLYVPLIGRTFEYLNLLPILGAAAMILSMKITPQPATAQNPQQKAIMTIMPIFFSFICYNFSSGLNLYILTSTVVGIAQTKLMAFVTIDPKELEKKNIARARKKQHFYTAAQNRKKRMAKEAKKDGKRAERDKKTTPAAHSD